MSSIMESASQENPEEMEEMLMVHSRVLCRGIAAFIGGLRVFVPLSRLHGEGIIQVVTGSRLLSIRARYMCIQQVILG